MMAAMMPDFLDPTEAARRKYVAVTGDSREVPELFLDGH
jgi:hypothetical protein